MNQEALLERPDDVGDRGRAELERRTAGWGLEVGGVELLAVEATGDADSVSP